MTSETDFLECDCPFCPLEKANVNVCDIRISFPTKDTVRYSDLQGYEQYENEFLKIVLWAKNNCKLRVGNTQSGKGGRCNYTVECWAKNHFKLCFHTEPEQTEEEMIEEVDKWYNTPGVKEDIMDRIKNKNWKK